MICGVSCRVDFAAAGRETRDGGFIYLLSPTKSDGEMISALHLTV